MENQEKTFDMSSDENSNYEGGVFYLKMVTKKDAQPFFTIKTKIGDSYTLLSQQPKSISGTLKSITTGSYTWEKKDIKTVKIVLEKDTKKGKQLAIISSSYTSTLRGIINCLLSFDEPINTIGINLYQNKLGYNSVMVFMCNGKRKEWKYAQSFLKTLVDVETTKKFGDVYYYGRLDDFLETELIKHLNTILPDSPRIVDETLEKNELSANDLMKEEDYLFDVEN